MSAPFDNKDGALSNARARRSGGDAPAPAWQPRFPDEPIRMPAPQPALQGTGAIRRVRPRKRRRGNDWVWVALAGGMIMVFAILVMGMFMVARLSQASQEVLPTAVIATHLPTPVDARKEYIADGRVVGVDVLSLGDGSLIELQPWNGQSRFTVVVGGLDRRPGDAGLTFRTDSLMILSIDPATKAIGVLSIPRDLLVQAPGFAEPMKINTVLPNGESRGGGPRLLQQTVQYNFGMRIHSYILMDFQALIDLVDIIGGIQISIDYTIDDPKYPDMNYGYDPLYIPEGTHWLNGYNALRFARTRHGNNDMRRAERQQQVLYAIHDRLLSFEMIPRLIAQAPQLWQTLSDNFYTSLELGQAVQLGLYVKDIDISSISTGVMNYNYVEDYTTDDGLFALVPIRERLPRLMTRVFGENYHR